MGWRLHLPTHFPTHLQLLETTATAAVQHHVENMNLFLQQVSRDLFSLFEVLLNSPMRVKLKIKEGTPKLFFIFIFVVETLTYNSCVLPSPTKPTRRHWLWSRALGCRAETRCRTKGNPGTRLGQNVIFCALVLSLFDGHVTPCLVVTFSEGDVSNSTYVFERISKLCWKNIKVKLWKPTRVTPSTCAW